MLHQVQVEITRLSWEKAMTVCVVDANSLGASGCQVQVARVGVSSGEGQHADTIA